MPFQKGRSGNPSGRPKKTPELLDIETLARETSPEAIKRLVRWMKSDNPRASIAACTTILERAWGKPRQAVEHKSAGNVALKIVFVDGPQEPGAPLNITGETLVIDGETRRAD